MKLKGNLQETMTRQKGKRWKRGQACLSNPDSKKHRLEAASIVRSKRQKVSTAHSSSDGLDVKLKDLTDMDFNDIIGDGDDATHITALSNWTIATEAAGTLPSFDRVRKLWNSPLDSHKEVCAVLTAVTEVIKSEGSNETPLAYFAALLTALETSDVVEQQIAISYLLSLVIPSVPGNIIRAKFAPATKLLFTILESQTNKNVSVALVRSLITSIGYIFMKQKPVVFREQSVTHMLNIIIGFVYHPKPKIRHVAQRSVANLSKLLPVVCTSALKSCVTSLNNFVGSKDEQVTLHTISFIRYILPSCDFEDLKSGIEALLEVITVRNTKITSASLQALRQVFKLSPAITGEMQGQILMNFFSNRPSNYDHPITTVWLEALSAGFSKLGEVEPKLGITMGHKLLSVCSDTVLSSNSDVVQTTLVTLEEYFTGNIPSGLKEFESDLCEKKKIPLSKSIDILDGMLKLAYQSVWDVVLQALGSLFENLNSNSSYLVEHIVPNLFSIRSAPNFENCTLFTNTAGRVIKLLGVEKILKIFPISFKDGEKIDIINSWLLPILKSNIEKSTLSYFTANILPLTATLKVKSETLRQQGNALDSKICNNLEYQLWNLLPSFCKSPRDLVESFKKIAKPIGLLLGQRPELRTVFCSSIITLITSAQIKPEEVSEIGRFAKNFLPILFNIFVAEPKPNDPPTNPVIDCIRSYLTVCNGETLSLLFNKIQTESNNSGKSEHARKAMWEILLAMIPNLEFKDLDTIYKQVVEWIGDPANPTKQKRGYQILHTIIESPKPSHIKFVTSHLEDFHKHLADSLALSSTACKKPRLKCLLALIKNLDIDGLNYIPNILPEIILCVKEQNEKTREAAYKCVVTIGYVLVEKADDKTKAIKDYFAMVIVGLTGSTVLASCTILCLTKILYEFNSFLPVDVLDHVLEVIVALMSSKQNEVLKAVISFIKTAVGVLPFQLVEPHLKPLLDQLGSWGKTTKHHFRAKIKALLERLLRRFGYEMLYKLSPLDYKKVVNNIVKEDRRNKRKKSEKKGDTNVDAESDEDDLGDFKDLSGRKSDRKSVTSQLVEGDNPLDFLESSMIPKIYKGTMKEPCSLPEKDGKLVIEELAEKVRDTKIEDSEDSHDEIVKVAQTNPFGRPSKGIHRKLTKPGGKKSEDGTTYKSKKSKGDMKKTGKPDPYAYISLKQKGGKKRVKGRFDNHIKAGKIGAKKGTKLKSLQKRRNKS